MAACLGELRCQGMLGHRDVEIFLCKVHSRPRLGEHSRDMDLDHCLSLWVPVRQHTYH
jgi:hypothetical protein